MKKINLNDEVNAKILQILPEKIEDIPVANKALDAIWQEEQINAMKDLMDMRSGELMLRDLVQVNGEAVKVISISYFDIGISDRKNNFYHEHIDNIEPIPLTAEILEKNFNSTEIPDDPYGAYFYESNEYVEVYIKEYTDGLWEVVVDEIEFSSLPTWKMYVSNVHQLQHALRLCGINKEIEI